MLFYLNTITVMYISSITGMLYRDTIFNARRSRASHELRRSESKKAKLKELSNNISDRSEARLVANPQYTILFAFYASKGKLCG